MSAFLADESQRELVAEFLRPLDAMFPVARLHEGDPTELARWGEIAELGWLGVSLSERAGGIGLGAIEEALMFEALGARLLSPRVLATVVGAHLAAACGDDALAGALAGGARVAALGIAGDPPTAIEPDGTDLLLILEDDRLALSTFTSEAMGGGTEWSLPLGEARIGNVVASRDDAALATLARLLIAAQLSGIAAAARDMAVDYAKLREQFGRPIGAFQATKHHCADMAMQALAASDLVGFAAAAVAGRRDDADFQALAALDVALRAARGNAGLNIQVHGGMGFSDECDAHLYLKRTHLLEAACGRIGAVRAALRKAAPAL